MLLKPPREVWPAYWEQIVRLYTTPWYAFRRRRRLRQWLRDHAVGLSIHLRAWEERSVYPRCGRTFDEPFTGDTCTRCREV